MTLHPKLLEAIDDVRNNRAQRVAVCGQWRVYRKDKTLVVELFEDAA
jgi:hypothetical protein